MISKRYNIIPFITNINNHKDKIKKGNQIIFNIGLIIKFNTPKINHHVKYNCHHQLAITQALIVSL
jgi:hypothetical protein